MKKKFTIEHEFKEDGELHVFTSPEIHNLHICHFEFKKACSCLGDALNALSKRRPDET